MTPEQKQQLIKFRETDSDSEFMSGDGKKRDLAIIKKLKTPKSYNRVLKENKHAKIIVMDEFNRGVHENQPCVNYEIRPLHKGEEIYYPDRTVIKFQNGAIGGSGTNGCHNEDLLHIVVDRLECFQEGNFACIENERALSSLRDCIGHLNSRTKEREDRGVEGTSQK